MSRMEKIALSRAINRTASDVTSIGEHFVYKKTNGMVLTKTPIKCGTYRNHKAKDFTGIRFGRLEIIGYRAPHGAQDRGRWVVKCDCGNYTTMQTKIIKKGSIDRCPECRALEVNRNKNSSIIQGRIK